MSLTGKKIALLIDNQYQEMEVWYPLYRLREAGAEVHTVGAAAGQTFTSKLGYPCKADKSYDEVDAAAYDGVIAPGGFAPDYIRRHPKANRFVADVNGQGKLVAADLSWSLGALLRSRHVEGPQSHQLFRYQRRCRQRRRRVVGRGGGGGQEPGDLAETGRFAGVL